MSDTSVRVSTPLTNLLKPRRPKLKKPPARHDARNREIYAAVKRGEKYAAIGRRFGTSAVPGVKQIAIEMETYFKNIIATCGREVIDFVRIGV